MTSAEALSLKAAKASPRSDSPRAVQARTCACVHHRAKVHMYMQRTGQAAA